MLKKIIIYLFIKIFICQFAIANIEIKARTAILQATGDIGHGGRSP